MFFFLGISRIVAGQYWLGVPLIIGGIALLPVSWWLLRRLAKG
jgi:hypothetical protein